MPRPPSVADRIAFWAHLHERLGKLANRVNAEAQGKVLAAIHAKVPMVTADEQRTLQLENAKADVQFWDSMSGLHASAVEDHTGLVNASNSTGANDICVGIVCFVFACRIGREFRRQLAFFSKLLPNSNEHLSTQRQCPFGGMLSVKC